MRHRGKDVPLHNEQDPRRSTPSEQLCKWTCDFTAIRMATPIASSSSTTLDNTTPPSAAYRRVAEALNVAGAAIAGSTSPSDRRISLDSVAPLTTGEWGSLNEAAGSILVDHDVANGKLKLRLVPGVTHNLAAGTLLVHLDTAFLRLGLRGKVRDLGATSESALSSAFSSKRLTPGFPAGIPLTGTRSKEADGALTPESRLARGLNVPSFIVEVGVSETTAMLLHDATDWLTSPRTSEWVRRILLSHRNEC